MENEPVKLIGRQNMMRKQQTEGQKQADQQVVADPFAQIILNMLQDAQTSQDGVEIQQPDTTTMEMAAAMAAQGQVPAYQDFAVAEQNQAQDGAVQQATVPTEMVTQMQQFTQMQPQAAELPQQEAVQMNQVVLADNKLQTQPKTANTGTVMQPVEEESVQTIGSDVPLQQATITATPRSRSLSEQFHMERSYRETVEQVRKQQVGGSSGDDATTVDVDALQAQADTHRAGLQQQISLSQTGQGTQSLDKTMAKQITEQLYSGLASGKSEFTIRLKPETLGEVTVKLTEKDGQMTLSLSAVNEKTVKLLNNQLDALREAVRPMQVEVKQAVVQTQTTDGNHMGQQMNMSNGGFYQQSHQASQSFYGNPQQGVTLGADVDETPAATEQQAVLAAKQIGENMLDLYV